jgi:nucleoside-diphosphate-sugar epimerase
VREAGPSQCPTRGDRDDASVLVTGAGVVGWLTAGMLATRGDPVVVDDVKKPARPLPPGVAFSSRDVTDQDLGFSCAHDLEDTIRYWSGP